MREAIEELFRMYNVEPTDDLLDALVLYVKHEQLNAKHELNVWLAAHGQQGLLELIDQLNEGEDFKTAYGK
jgi:hypothetical protein